jgi:hypothetical protein
VAKYECIFVLGQSRSWKLDGIVGGGAVFAFTYSLLNAVRNKTLNSRVFPLIVRQEDVSIPVFDTTLLHSQMAVDWILGKPGIAQVRRPVAK